MLSGSMTAEFVWVDNTDALTGYTTADLQVTTGSDWTAAALLLTLTHGSIYQDAAGSATTPNAGLFGTFPTLEYDTYVSANGGTPSIAGGAGDVGGDAYQFDTVELDISWFDTTGADTGTITIGRITLSDDAVGTWSLKLLNNASEKYVVVNMAFSNGELAEPPDPPASEAVNGDFTGDGKADIFWHDTASGENSVWEMDGTTFTVEHDVRRIFNTDWKVVGTGDFTGDGKNDLLLRNVSDGSNAIWEMDGTDFVQSIYLKELAYTAWQVAGVGDFNGDGSKDILWRHTGNGKNAVWEMNGTDFVTATFINELTNLKWQAVGVGDFNGDNKDDILWRHSDNGRNTVWEMDGLTFSAASALRRVKNLSWQVAGIADYTGDGKADILWRNTSNGDNLVWEMNNEVYLGVLWLPSRVDLDDQPAGPILGLWEG